MPKIIKQRLWLTIGNDPNLGEVTDILGREPVTCPVDNIVVNVENKVVTTPDHMLLRPNGEAASGINKLVLRVLDLTE